VFHGLRTAGLLLLAALLALAACVAPPTPTAVVETAAAGPEPGSEPVQVALGLGYIPSVQFAPFYVAQKMGFFAGQGLEVDLRNGVETDFLKLVATDEMQFVIASGEQVILGRAQGLPVTYVAAWYRKFPVVVFAPASGGIAAPADLQGKRVGIPGLYGASLVGWKALVYATGIDESQVSLESIGFTQAAAVQEGRVDAAIDYVVNGPVQLRAEGQDVNVIAVSDYINLPANGLITNQKTLLEKPDLVQKMVTATLQGVQYTLANPDQAFAISIEAVPEAGGDNEAINRAIFDASLVLWQADAADLGRTSLDSWGQAADFMLAMGLIDQEVPVDDIATNRFVEAAGLQ
jgi:NitT/TauT family transport system substrate-binding protein